MAVRASNHHNEKCPAVWCRSGLRCRSDVRLQIYNVASEFRSIIRRMVPLKTMDLSICRAGTSAASQFPGLWRPHRPARHPGRQQSIGIHNSQFDVKNDRTIVYFKSVEPAQQSWNRPTNSSGTRQPQTTKSLSPIGERSLAAAIVQPQLALRENLFDGMPVINFDSLSPRNVQTTWIDAQLMQNGRVQVGYVLPFFDGEHA